MNCGGFNNGVTFLSGWYIDSSGTLQSVESGRWALHGAVNWGSLICSGLDRYTVFTRVSAYINGVNKNGPQSL